MRPKTIDLLEVLDSLAPSSLSEEWDNAGLQVGSLSREIDKILLSLDPTLPAVREAGRRRAQVLLNHHPLLFRPISSVNEDLYPGSVIKEAVAGGVTVISVHTNLDAAVGGINDILARLLNLKNVEPLLMSQTSGPAGMARIGQVPEPLRLADFVQILKAALSTEKMRIVGNGDRMIRRAAVMGGSGGSMISSAFEMGADVFVTGDITHHQAMEANTLGLAVVDAGHFRMEQTAFFHFADELEKALREKGWAVEVQSYQEEKDPLI